MGAGPDNPFCCRMVEAGHGPWAAGTAAGEFTQQWTLMLGICQSPPAATETGVGPGAVTGPGAPPTGGLRHHRGGFVPRVQDRWLCRFLAFLPHYGPDQLPEGPRRFVHCQGLGVQLFSRARRSGAGRPANISRQRRSGTGHCELCAQFCSEARGRFNSTMSFIIKRLRISSIKCK